MVVIVELLVFGGFYFDFLFLIVEFFILDWRKW